MRAKVIEIQSGTKYRDGDERLMLQITDADGLYNEIRVRRGLIDTTHELQLDSELELTLTPIHADSIKVAQIALGKMKAKVERHES